MWVVEKIVSLPQIGRRVQEQRCLPPQECSAPSQLQLAQACGEGSEPRPSNLHQTCLLFVLFVCVSLSLLGQRSVIILLKLNFSSVHHRWDRASQISKSWQKDEQKANLQPGPLEAAVPDRPRERVTTPSESLSSRLGTVPPRRSRRRASQKQLLQLKLRRRRLMGRMRRLVAALPSTALPQAPGR